MSNSLKTKRCKECCERIKINNKYCCKLSHKKDIQEIEDVECPINEDFYLLDKIDRNLGKITDIA